MRIGIGKKLTSIPTGKTNHHNFFPIEFWLLYPSIPLFHLGTLFVDASISALCLSTHPSRHLHSIHLGSTFRPCIMFCKAFSITTLCFFILQVSFGEVVAKSNGLQLATAYRPGQDSYGGNTAYHSQGQFSRSKAVMDSTQSGQSCVTTSSAYYSQGLVSLGNEATNSTALQPEKDGVTSTYYPQGQFSLGMIVTNLNVLQSGQDDVATGYHPQGQFSLRKAVMTSAALQPGQDGVTSAYYAQGQFSLGKVVMNSNALQFGQDDVTTAYHPQEQFSLGKTVMHSAALQSGQGAYGVNTAYHPQHHQHLVSITFYHYHHDPSFTISTTSTYRHPSFTVSFHHDLSFTASASASVPLTSPTTSTIFLSGSPTPSTLAGSGSHGLSKNVQIGLGIGVTFTFVFLSAIGINLCAYYQNRAVFRRFRQIHGGKDFNTTLRRNVHGLLEYCTPPVRRRCDLDPDVELQDMSGRRRGRGLAARMVMRRPGGSWPPHRSGRGEDEEAWGDGGAWEVGEDEVESLGGGEERRSWVVV